MVACRSMEPLDWIRAAFAFFNDREYVFAKYILSEENAMVKIIQGDALSLLRTFEPNTFDAVITDPPYSSGGMTKSTREQSTSKKYTNSKGKCPLPDFEGDSKDQRSWTSWMAEWLQLARRACKPGAPIVLFIDWRQYPSLTDALQWAGWIWRGVAVWDKGNCRPQRGRPKQKAEFIVWGSNGAMPIDRDAPVMPGVYHHQVPNQAGRLHQTEKPLTLMRALVPICEPGGHILDPFAGSGTTLEAALLEGYDATGIELSAAYAEIARTRLERAECQIISSS